MPYERQWKKGSQFCGAMELVDLEKQGRMDVANCSLFLYVAADAYDGLFWKQQRVDCLRNRFSRDDVIRLERFSLLDAGQNGFDI